MTEAERIEMRRRTLVPEASKTVIRRKLKNMGVEVQKDKTRQPIVVTASNGRVKSAKTVPIKKVRKYYRELAR